MRRRTLRTIVLCALTLGGCSHPPSARQGLVLYRENGCASCHGLSGRGDGPAAATLPAKPTDLNHPEMFKRGSGEMTIAQTLADGITGAESSIPALHHSHHEFVMPKFDHLTEMERRSIALYVISLRGN